MSEARTAGITCDVEPMVGADSASGVADVPVTWRGRGYAAAPRTCALDGSGIDAAQADVRPTWPAPRGPLAPWERRRLGELGGLLAEARAAAGVELADLVPIAGAASSLRQIERGRFRTRRSRLRPWLERLGVDPEPVLEAFADVIAPDRLDSRTGWRPAPRPSARKPWAPPTRREAAAHDRAELGVVLWRIRIDARLTRPSLGDRLGCTAFHIWMVERGDRRPSEELLAAWLELGSQAQRTMVALRFRAVIQSLTTRGAAGWADAGRRVAPANQSHHAPGAQERPGSRPRTKGSRR